MNEMLNESLLERAKGLNGLLNAQAPLNEAAGRLTDTTIDALYETGIVRMLLPKPLGGYEVWPTEALEVFEALSYADGSTGWVTMATQISIATAGAYLDPSASREIFAPNKKLPLIAGQGAPNGKAEVDGKGYRLTTKGSYGSGLLHSSYFHTGSIVTVGGVPRMLPGTQSPDARIFIVPVERGELLGNWDVMGLRATGSVDYAITDVHVPEEFTHSLSANKAKLGGELYQLGISGLGNIGHSGFALGVARRALDELAKLANQPGGKPANLSMGAGEGFQEAYGAGEAQLRAARALLMDVHGENEATLKRGDTLAVRQVTLSRLALNHVTTAAADICAMSFKFAGGAALRASTLQRFVRDMMGGAQHITTSPFMLRECSKELMGAAKGKVWSLRGLVDPVK